MLIFMTISWSLKMDLQDIALDHIDVLNFVGGKWTEGHGDKIEVISENDEKSVKKSFCRLIGSGAAEPETIDEVSYITVIIAIRVS